MTTPRHAQGDSPPDSIKSGTQRLLDEPDNTVSLATHSASEVAIKPVTQANDSGDKEIVRTTKRKPRSPKSAAHQAEYHKRWRQTEQGRAALCAANKRWRDRFPERQKAHERVSYALRSGRLVKGPCALAGDDCKGRIEAHHDDYSKPLEVRWACKAHHRLLDQERRQGAA